MPIWLVPKYFKAYCRCKMVLFAWSAIAARRTILCVDFADKIESPRNYEKLSKRGCIGAGADYQSLKRLPFKRKCLNLYARLCSQ